MYMDTQFYTLSEAATKLNCNERILRNKLGAGEITGYKRMNKWYILHKDLLAYIEGGGKKKVA